MGDFHCGLVLKDLLVIGPICQSCVDRMQCAKEFIKARKNGNKKCQHCGRNFTRVRGGWANFRRHENVCNKAL